MSKIHLEKPIIIKNLFSEKYMDRIENSCIKSPWKYSNNITYGENYKNIQNGFSLSFDETTIQYNLYQYLIFKSCEKINFESKKIIRVRKRLTYPNKELYDIPYQPHVDYNYNHLVLLYYVNRSNGSTYIYNEKYSKKNRKEFSLLEKVDFERGKLTIFNGKNYHASSLSSDTNRIVLNINLLGRFKN